MAGERQARHQDSARQQRARRIGAFATRKRRVLTKSRFLSGLQCPRRLWWEVHEPTAPELEPSPELQAIFARGHEVGELARDYVPGGVLIDLPHHALRERAAATARALAGGASAIYEASFLEEDVFVAVDILRRRRRGGFDLIEVKSTLDVKPEHLPDVAVQLHVLRRAGLDVRRAQVMHLSRECRHPDLSRLFVREDVTREAEEAGRGLRRKLRAMLASLGGPCPDEQPGARCSRPHDCPFWDRCSSALPEHHVSTLWNIRTTKAEELVAGGCETIFELPPGFERGGPTHRQIQSVRSGKTVVRRGSLRKALAALRRPFAYLDFETVSLPIPVWPGCRPYQQIPVQMSCHTEVDGALRHRAWLARGPEDPRPKIARAIVDACAGAKSIIVYTRLEERCLDDLAGAVPELGRDLRRIVERLVDLHPLVRDHVYHPDFGGSFSLKSVVPALVPDLAYDDLEIHDGAAASAVLEALLVGERTFAALEEQALRRSLRRYCERDTLAMVRVHERLVELGQS